MRLRVSHVRQPGPLSYIVKYVADVEVIVGEALVTVEVTSTIPEAADSSLVTEAADAIKRGAESVLKRRAAGAILHAQGLSIHPADFAPQKYELVTAEELLKALVAIA